MKILKSLLLSLAMVSGLAACAQDRGFRSVSADEFETVIADTSVVLIDVRTAAEHMEGHIPHTIYNIDILQDGFIGNVKANIGSNEKTLAIYCRSGRRSKSAANILVKNGYTVIELGSGYNGWLAAGKPIE